MRLLCHATKRQGKQRASSTATTARHGQHSQARSSQTPQPGMASTATTARHGHHSHHSQVRPAQPPLPGTVSTATTASTARHGQHSQAKACGGMRKNTERICPHSPARGDNLRRSVGTTLFNQIKDLPHVSPVSPLSPRKSMHPPAKTAGPSFVHSTAGTMTANFLQLRAS